jgi:hypothetical protein
MLKTTLTFIYPIKKDEKINKLIRAFAAELKKQGIDLPHDNVRTKGATKPTKIGKSHAHP